MRGVGLTGERVAGASRTTVILAAALLFGGGSDALTALQAAAITVGLPFTLVLIAMCFSLYLGLRHEQRFAKVGASAG